MKFKPGDLIKLKSGGPIMTVGSITVDESVVSTSWFVEGDLHQANFYIEMVIDA